MQITLCTTKKRYNYETRSSIHEGRQMSYKDRIKTAIEAIPKEEDCFDEKVLEQVEAVYQEALEDARVTGESVESVTYEILEGLEEALLERDETLLTKATDKMTEVIHNSAQNCISAGTRRVDLATRQLEETVEREKAHLIESLEAFKAFAAERSLHRFSSHLAETESRIKNLMHKLGERIAQLGRKSAKSEEQDVV